MKKIITLFAVMFTTLSVSAVENIDSVALSNPAKRVKIQRVGADIERDINSKKFIYKGEWMTGVSASYTTFSASDADFLLFVDNIEANFAMISIKPYAGYFYRDNRAIGAKFGYSYINGSVDAARIDLGVENDIQIDIPYIGYSGQYYTGSIFHRSYTALDTKGRFGLFAEVDLGATSGYSVFEYGSGDDYVYTKSDKTSVGLTFNPGVSAFVMNNVSASLSFEFGGISYTNIKQYDENGVQTGGRESSGMSFKFNFLAINLGVTVHIW